MLLRKMIIPLLFLLALPLSTPVAAETKNEVYAAVAKEGNLYIYGAIDRKVADQLVKEFNALNPGVKVDFISLSSSDVFSWHVRDVASRKVSADILWNSDIKLQAALVKDGYALKYMPEENSGVMKSANIADSAYVTGFDPVVMAYNKKLVSEKELPLTRTALVKALKDERWKGKMGTCDPEKNDLAFFLLTQDLAYGDGFWGLVRRFGDAGLKLYPDYRTLLGRIEAGEVVAGYNIPLSEVLKSSGDDKPIGWGYTADYNLAVPQTVLITKRATNPNAARLWVDFIRSKKAQQIISESCNLFPVRSDVAGGEMKKRGRTLPPDRVLRMVGTGSEVTRFNDDGMRRGFLLRWKQLLKLVK